MIEWNDGDWQPAPIKRPLVVKSLHVRKPRRELPVGFWPLLALTVTLIVVVVLYLVMVQAALSSVPDPAVPTSSPAPQALAERLDAITVTSRSEQRQDAHLNQQAVTRIRTVLERRQERREARAAGAAADTPAPTPDAPTGPPAVSTGNVSPFSPTSPAAVEAFLPEPWRSVADCETGGTFDLTIVDSSGTYFGLFQFTVSTWQSVGGGGLPSEASAAEQLTRAQQLYQRDGASPWPVCGSAL